MTLSLAWWQGVLVVLLLLVVGWVVLSLLFDLVVGLWRTIDVRFVRTRLPMLAADAYAPSGLELAELRRHLAEFERQSDAGELWAVAHGGRIVMLHQYRSGPLADGPDPVRAVRRSFRQRFPQMVDEDGDPVKPDAIFRVAVSSKVHEPPDFEGLRATLALAEADR